jgi:hypothetical protein
MDQVRLGGGSIQQQAMVRLDATMDTRWPRGKPELVLSTHGRKLTDSAACLATYRELACYGMN